MLLCCAGVGDGKASWNFGMSIAVIVPCTCVLAGLPHPAKARPPASKTMSRQFVVFFIQFVMFLIRNYLPTVVIVNHHIRFLTVPASGAGSELETSTNWG